MNRATICKLWVLTPLMALASVFTLGCGSASDASQGAALDQPVPEVGNQVGQRIQPFTMRLADDSTVTSANLVSQGKPTFLLYFKHP